MLTKKKLSQGGRAAAANLTKEQRSARARAAAAGRWAKRVVENTDTAVAWAHGDTSKPLVLPHKTGMGQVAEVVINGKCVTLIGTEIRCYEPLLLLDAGIDPTPLLCHRWRSGGEQGVWFSRAFRSAKAAREFFDRVCERATSQLG